MKRIITSTFTAIAIMLLLTAFNLNAFSQTTVILPNGESGSSAVLSSASETNVIFSSSSSSSSNVLILNGISVPVIGSGWYTSEGLHILGNANYYCGNNGSIFYRNFFAIDLSGLVGYGITLPITSAVLHLVRYNCEPATGSQLFELSDVSAQWATINQDYSSGSAVGVNVFNDLGTGSSFGSVLVDKTVTGTPIEVTLNSNGLSALNSAVGSTIILGGKADSSNPVPVSMWVIVLGFALIALLAVWRFRKRQLA
jgi:hypothetical protein